MALTGLGAAGSTYSFSFSSSYSFYPVTHTPSAGRKRGLGKVLGCCQGHTAEPRFTGSFRKLPLNCCSGSGWEPGARPGMSQSPSEDPPGLPSGFAPSVIPLLVQVPAESLGLWAGGAPPPSIPRWRALPSSWWVGRAPPRAELATPEALASLPTSSPGLCWYRFPRLWRLSLSWS